jgi:hypothetical protein
MAFVSALPDIQPLQPSFGSSVEGDGPRIDQPWQANTFHIILRDYPALHAAGEIEDARQLPTIYDRNADDAAGRETLVATHLQARMVTGQHDRRPRSSSAMVSP